MRRFIALCLVVPALALAACGGDDKTTTEETVVTEQAAPPAPPPQTSTQAGTSTNCSVGEVYSFGAGSCVQQRSGNNPCPPGEIPAADAPTCLPKN